MLDFWSGAGWEWNRGWRFVRFDFCAQMLACAGDGESLIIEQLFDAQNVFDVALAVHTLAGAALDWLQLWEFRFPEPQHVGGQVAQRCHFADAKIKFVRDEDFRRVVLRRVLFARCHVRSAPSSAWSAYCDTQALPRMQEFRGRH